MGPKSKPTKFKDATQKPKPDPLAKKPPEGPRSRSQNKTNKPPAKPNSNLKPKTATGPLFNAYPTAKKPEQKTNDGKANKSAPKKKPNKIQTIKPTQKKPNKIQTIKPTQKMKAPVKQKAPRSIRQQPLPAAVPQAQAPVYPEMTGAPKFSYVSETDTNLSPPLKKKKCEPEDSTLSERPETYGYAEDETEEEFEDCLPMQPSEVYQKPLEVVPGMVSVYPKDETEEEYTESEPLMACQEGIQQGMKEMAFKAKPEKTTPKPAFSYTQIKTTARTALNMRTKPRQWPKRIVDRENDPLLRYTKVFSTQVDDKSKPVRSNRKWTSGFAVKVLLVLSLIHYCQFALCMIPAARDLSADLRGHHSDKIITVVVIAIVILSFCSGIYELGKTSPVNVVTMFGHVFLWTTVWETLSRSWSHSHVPFVIETVATSCLILAIILKMRPEVPLYAFLSYKIELNGSSIYSLAITIVIVHFGGIACLSYFGAIGALWTEDSWMTLLTNLTITNITGGVIFVYICLELHEMLRGNRPVAWPTQWLYGVNLVYTDFVWMCWEGLKLTLYLLPCTYCKDGRHTIWKRWGCCRHNYRVRGHA